jgi:hypothetical protein
LKKQPKQWSVGKRKNIKNAFRTRDNIIIQIIKWNIQRSFKQIKKNMKSLVAFWA